MAKRISTNSDKTRQRAGDHTASASSPQSAADVRVRKRAVKKQGGKTGAGQDNDTAASDRPIMSWRQDDGTIDNPYAANTANMMAFSQAHAVRDANSREVSPEVVDDTLPGLASSELPFSNIAASNVEYGQGLFPEFRNHLVTAEQLRYPPAEDFDAETHFALEIETAIAAVSFGNVYREDGLDPQAAFQQASASVQSNLSAGPNHNRL